MLFSSYTVTTKTHKIRHTWIWTSSSVMQYFQSPIDYRFLTVDTSENRFSTTTYVSWWRFYNEQDETASANKILAIVFGVLGGIMVLALVIVGINYLVKRRKRKNNVDRPIKAENKKKPEQAHIQKKPEHAHIPKKPSPIEYQNPVNQPLTLESGDQTNKGNGDLTNNPTNTGNIMLVKEPSVMDDVKLAILMDKGKL